MPLSGLGLGRLSKCGDWGSSTCEKLKTCQKRIKITDSLIISNHDLPIPIPELQFNMKQGSSFSFLFFRRRMAAIWCFSPPRALPVFPGFPISGEASRRLPQNRRCGRGQPEEKAYLMKVHLLCKFFVVTWRPEITDNKYYKYNKYYLINSMSNSKLKFFYILLVNLLFRPKSIRHLKPDYFMA